MNLTKNFTREEMACKHCGECKMDEGFMAKLQLFRDTWGKPLKITSGYRCETHNKASKGAPNSKHMEGIAVDIDTHLMPSSERYALVRMAFNQGFSGIGLAKTFLHIDTRKDGFLVWVY